MLLKGDDFAAQGELGGRIFQGADQGGIDSIFMTQQVRALRDESDAPGTAGMAARDLFVITFFPLKGGIITPVGAIGVLGGGEVVIEAAFEFVAKPGFARELQKGQVKLDPGCADAGFADVRGYVVGEQMIFVKVFPRTGGTGDIESILDDILPGIE